MPRPIRPGREIRVLREDRKRHCLIQDVNNYEGEITARLGTPSRAETFLAIDTESLATSTRPTSWITGVISPTISPFLDEPLLGYPNLELDDVLYGLLDEALLAA